VSRYNDAYFCTLTRVKYGTISNKIRVFFHARCDGSNGQLQDPRESRIGTIEQVGSGSQAGLLRPDEVSVLNRVRQC